VAAVFTRRHLIRPTSAIPSRSTPAAAPQPLVLGQRDGEPARCFLCTRSLPGQPATKASGLDGEERIDVAVAAINQHREQKLERHRDLLRALGVEVEGGLDE
jgi:hypothetical protein